MGTIAAKHSPDSPIATLETSSHRLAPCAGTSTCFIVQSPEGVFVPGVWGPYKNAVFPGWWMNEGGQSSTGQVITCDRHFEHHLNPLLVNRLHDNYAQSLPRTGEDRRGAEEEYSYW